MESVHVNVHLDCLATLISGVDQTASNGVCTCKCPSGLSGNPYLECRLECVLNSDCDRTLACASNKCVNLCPRNCGFRAKCRVINPSGNEFCGPYSNQRVIPGSNLYQCSCLKGYIGAPPNCRPECVVISDCPQDMANQQQKCSDPCVATCGYRIHSLAAP